jgi:2,4-diketo-3-deoxy-L-fuconate hydrolase
MKLVRFGDPGREKPGVVLDDKTYDTSTFGVITTSNFLPVTGCKSLWLL